MGINPSQATSQKYPVSLSIDYPARLDRLSTFFRIILIIPIALVVYLISGCGIGSYVSKYAISSQGFLIFGPMALIVFRQKYPKWWFDWNLEFARFHLRVTAYAFLMRDEYPSTDEAQSVHLNISYPDAKKLNRYLPLIKWFLAIPHYVALFFLGIAAFVGFVIAWFTVVITGSYPKVLFNFIEGFLRWCVRVNAYAFILVTDEYPPFSLDP